MIGQPGSGGSPAGSCGPVFRFDCGPCVVRPWRSTDLAALLRHADNPKVAANLRDRFPSPYTEADGRAWLDLAAGGLAATNWAIEVAGEAAGGIGLMPQDDVNEGTAEIGYWLGEAVWGRGVATAAVAAVTRRALTALGYRRLFATVFGRNGASQRVLEKCGYRREGVLRRAVVKHGVVLDQVVYGILPDDLP